MDREARIWRRLALAGAGAVALLTGRLVMLSRGDVRSVWQLMTRGVNDDGETRNEEIERRLHACEASIQNLWEAHNARGPGNG